jgi:hypothetical protein
MQTKELSPEQIKQLKAPLPAEAVKPHPTKTFLSSIKAIYVVERLNDVFGIGKWHLRSEIIDNKTAMIVVKATLTVPEYGIDLESYGGNDNGGENSKNHDLGDAYKGAVTDALTKIGSYLGIAMDVYKGLAGTGNGNGKASTSNGQEGAKNDDKPWMNKGTKEYNGAVAKLKAGTTTIDKIAESFKISKEMREEFKGYLPA